MTNFMKTALVASLIFPLSSAVYAADPNEVTPDRGNRPTLAPPTGSMPPPPTLDQNAFSQTDPDLLGSIGHHATENLIDDPDEVAAEKAKHTDYWKGYFLQKIFPNVMTEEDFKMHLLAEHLKPMFEFNVDFEKEQVAFIQLIEDISDCSPEIVQLHGNFYTRHQYVKFECTDIDMLEELIETSPLIESSPCEAHVETFDTNIFITDPETNKKTWLKLTSFYSDPELGG